MATDDLPVKTFKSAKAWEIWLAKQHAKSDGLWLQLAKKDSGIASATYAEAVEVALCYGWIDGLKRPFDGTYWIQRFTPRRPRSKWSANNKAKVEALIEAGRMQPAGLREVEAARVDGRWEASYPSSATMEVPEDFSAALAKRPKAHAAFGTLSRTNRYAFLFRVHDAKRPETRARRITQFVEMITRGETPYPQRESQGESEDLMAIRGRG